MSTPWLHSTSTPSRSAAGIWIPGGFFYGGVADGGAWEDPGCKAELPKGLGTLMLCLSVEYLLKLLLYHCLRQRSVL